MKLYPIVDKEGNICPLEVENEIIRIKTYQMVNNAKTENDYSRLFMSAYKLWLNKNCCEAFYRCRAAAINFAKEYMAAHRDILPPKEIMLMADLLREHRIDYAENHPYTNNCRYNE